jgi:hypothetical protein
MKALTAAGTCPMFSLNSFCVRILLNFFGSRQKIMTVYEGFDGGRASSDFSLNSFCVQILLNFFGSRQKIMTVYEGFDGGRASSDVLTQLISCANSVELLRLQTENHEGI